MRAVFLVNSCSQQMIRSAK